MESKYNLLTRLLKNIKNVITPDGGVAGSGGGVPVVHVVTEETVALFCTLPDVAGYQWFPRESSPSGEVTEGPFIQIDYDASVLIPGVFIKRTSWINWKLASHVINSGGKIKIDVSEFGTDGAYPIEDDFAGALIKVVSESSTRLDKTYKELVDSGFFVAHFETDPNAVGLLIPGAFESSDFGCRVNLLDVAGGSMINFVASTENDYPVLVIDRPPSGDDGFDRV